MIVLRKNKHKQAHVISLPGSNKQINLALVLLKTPSDAFSWKLNIPSFGDRYQPRQLIKLMTVDTSLLPNDDRYRGHCTWIQGNSCREIRGCGWLDTRVCPCAREAPHTYPEHTSWIPTVGWIVPTIGTAIPVPRELWSHYQGTKEIQFMVAGCV